MPVSARELLLKSWIICKASAQVKFHFSASLLEFWVSYPGKQKVTYRSLSWWIHSVAESLVKKLTHNQLWCIDRIMYLSLVSQCSSYVDDTFKCVRLLYDSWLWVENQLSFLCILKPSCWSIFLNILDAWLPFWSLDLKEFYANSMPKLASALWTLEIPQTLHIVVCAGLQLFVNQRNIPVSSTEQKDLWWHWLSLYLLVTAFLVSPL